MLTFTLHPQLETDTIFVRDLPVAQLRLMNQKALPWLILIPRQNNIREIHQLDEPTLNSLIAEIAKTSRALEHLFKPTKINMGAIGNIVPQLHIHLVARFTSDPAWPNPVWGRLPHLPYSSEETTEILSQLNNSNFWN